MIKEAALLLALPPYIDNLDPVFSSFDNPISRWTKQ